MQRDTFVLGVSLSDATPARVDVIDVLGRRSLRARPGASAQAITNYA